MVLLIITILINLLTINIDHNYWQIIQCMSAGLNKGGQCGTGTSSKEDNVPEPRPVVIPDNLDDDSDAAPPVLDTIRQVVLGRSHSSLLTESGRVFVWGESGFGRLGILESGMSSGG